MTTLTTTMTQPFEIGTMTQTVSSSSWEAAAYQQALALKDLLSDWDRGRTLKPTTEAINGALECIDHIASLGFDVVGGPFVSPIGKGGVQLEWEHGGRHLSIEVLPDGSGRWLMAEGADVHEGDLDTFWSPDVGELFGWLAAAH